jgi:hypothetical protein
MEEEAQVSGSSNTAPRHFEAKSGAKVSPNHPHGDHRLLKLK